MSEPFSWSEMYRRRQEAARHFGTIFSLPIVKRVREVLWANVKDGQSVLEIGAGDRSMEQRLHERCRNVRYESLDIDPRGQHEYRDLTEVARTFDVVCAFEVIEHLSITDIPGWLSQLAKLLVPGGRLLLSTPNTFYPPAFLRDATHRTPLCYDELAGLVAGAGLEVEQIVRIYHDPVYRKLLRRYLFGWLFRLIGIDYARQIVLIARKA